MSMIVDYDEVCDVIYVRRDDARTVNSEEAPNDGCLILSDDAQGETVAAKLLFVSEMPPEFWWSHPDRGLIPADVLSAMDAWIGGRR